MELIQNNPYRIAGILSNFTERELQKQKAKTRAYSKVGKETKSEYDFQILDNITRTEESINKAFSHIQQNQDKVNFALFWFLNANPFDNAAIAYLKKGNEDKAVEIWEKVTLNKEVNSKNFSAFNNLGTYKLLSQDHIKQGIEAKIKLIESDYFENFVHSVADKTFTIDNEKQIEILVDELLMQFKNQYSSSETLQLFSNCNGSTQKYLSKKFTEEPIHEIESKIEINKKKRKGNRSGAYEFGSRLFTNTKENLSLLKSILGTNDLKYKAVADQLANEILQCGIDYFNESKKNNSIVNYLESAKKLIKLADSIKVGKLTEQRIQDSLTSIEELKDSEIKQLIQLFHSIKNAFRTNGDLILLNVNKLISEDIDLKAGKKGLNIKAINENIENCIDWEKANNLVIDALDEKKIFNLKYNTKKKLKDELIGLIKWYERCSQVKSDISDIIEKYNNLKPKIPFQILSSEIINIYNNPFYYKYLDDIKIVLKLEVFESSIIDFNVNKKTKFDLLNKLLEDADLPKINIYDSHSSYDLSPAPVDNVKVYNRAKNNLKYKLKIPGTEIKYYHKESIKLNEGLTEVVLPCYKCNKINENMFEVKIYIEDLEILTKTFEVIEAPSAKIRRELLVAEDDLELINQADFFATEIESAEKGMNVIKIFKFFRPKAEKIAQIKSQQNKIEQLIEKSKKEKKKKRKTQEEKIYKLKMELSVSKY